ncbi:MAG: hypothetical protein IT425_12810 [Pirellulales bacterium]|nr:hypothetical protein [Pirellulales bacterium]
MPSPDAQHDSMFGYLTAVETAELGYFGGYLIVSHLGRPLEFHCTAPIRPSRAQQILYGPTLEPYLLGEQISSALLSVAKLAPRVILTDCDATLGARERFAIPMARLFSPNRHLPNRSRGDECVDGAAPVASSRKPEAPLRANLAGTEFAFEPYRLMVPLGYESDEAVFLELLKTLTRHVVLDEPFERIREAIREAQRIGGRGTDAHDEAA